MFFLQDLDHFPVSRCKHRYNPDLKSSAGKDVEKYITNSSKTCQIPYPPAYSLQAPTPTNQLKLKDWIYRKIYSTSIPQARRKIYIFRLSSAVHTEQKERDKDKERTIPQAYSCQTQPSTFRLSVDKLWATSKLRTVCNCFNLFPFSGGDFSHSQEINIKYCLQHNPLASPGVLLCRMRPTEQHVTQQMDDSLQKNPIIEGIVYCM